MSAVGSKSGVADWKTTVPYQKQPEDDFLSVSLNRERDLKAKEEDGDGFVDLGDEFDFIHTSAKSPEPPTPGAQTEALARIPSPESRLNELELHLPVNGAVQAELQSATQTESDGRSARGARSPKTPDPSPPPSPGKISSPPANPLSNSSIVQLAEMGKEPDRSLLEEPSPLPSSTTAPEEPTGSAALQRRPSKNAVTIDVAPENTLAPLSSTTASLLIDQLSPSQIKLIEEKSPRTFGDSICHFFRSICCPFGSKSKKT